MSLVSSSTSASSSSGPCSIPCKSSSTVKWLENGCWWWLLLCVDTAESSSNLLRPGCSAAFGVDVDHEVSFNQLFERESCRPPVCLLVSVVGWLFSSAFPPVSFGFAGVRGSRVRVARCETR